MGQTIAAAQRFGKKAIEDPIEELERRAIAKPEEREEILEVLNSYSRRFSKSAEGKAARIAAERIAAVIMLEELKED